MAQVSYLKDYKVCCIRCLSARRLQNGFLPTGWLELPNSRLLLCNECLSHHFNNLVAVMDERYGQMAKAHSHIFKKD